ncbi:MAG: hypothetical protein CMF31_06980 [Kordiimonas sp.]|nr:hypothetical protein [Kordiimonas sp.]|tara:strand:+ start:1784 stop:2695 length:912 start_codon:yes stop_codon:yes gene_type:complete
MLAEQRHILRHLTEVGLQAEQKIDLAGVALMLASLDRPRVSLQKYQHHLEILGLDLNARAENCASAEQRAEALQAVMVDTHGYSGDRHFYDDLQNANLMSVIDRRAGLPVALGILYIHAARTQGWPAEGVNFPAHFLIRIGGAQDHVIMDPFNGGKILHARDLRQKLHAIAGQGRELKPDYYRPVTDRNILLRLLNNIKTRALKVSDLILATQILKRMVLIDPHHIDYKYELGMLQAHQGDLLRGHETLMACLRQLRDRNDPREGLLREQVMTTLEDIRASQTPRRLEVVGFAGSEGDTEKDE